MLKKISTILICICLLSAAYAQRTIEGCYSENVKVYEKLSFKNYGDSSLKKKIEYYFSCDDTKQKPRDYFIHFKPYFVNDSIVKLKTNNGYEVEIATTAFQKERHTLMKDSHGDLCQIDNKTFYGTDLDEPIEEIKNVQVKFRNRLIGLAADEFSDLYNPFLNWSNGSRITLLHDQDHLLILMYASDGAGSYAAMWIFKNGKYIGRIVDKLC